MSSSFEQLEQRDLFAPAGSVPCSRCGQPCRVAADSNADARLLKHALTAFRDGLCANCAMTAFIRSVDTLMYGIEKNGLAMLRDPRVQAGFEGVMQAGKADAEPDEIDWERVIATWDLPFPRVRRRGGRGGTS